jgi:hypothetical protein
MGSAGAPPVGSFGFADDGVTAGTQEVELPGGGFKQLPRVRSSRGSDRPPEGVAGPA